MKARKEIARFFIGGTVITAADFSIYFILFQFLPFSVSKGISFSCAGILGYWLNKYWIFEHHQPSYAEMGRYVLINFLALGINVLVNRSILNVWPGGVYLALASATAITSIWVFICFKGWVYIQLS
jgi:putative flippase GtrA